MRESPGSRVTRRPWMKPKPGYLLAPLSPRFDLSIIPYGNAVFAHQRLEHRLQSIEPVFVLVAVTDEHLIADVGFRNSGFGSICFMIGEFRDPRSKPGDERNEIHLPHASRRIEKIDGDLDGTLTFQ